MGYLRYMQSLAPPWLGKAGGYGQAWLSAHGQLIDDQVANLKAAVKVAFPTLAPTDALPALGDERGVDRAAGVTFETDADYALRLRGAWDNWPFAGSAYSILKALYAVGYTQPVVVQQNGLGFNLDATQSLVVTDLGVNPNVSGSPPWWTFDSGLDAGASSGRPLGEGPTQQFASRFALLFPTYPSSWTSVQATLTSSTSPTLAEVNRIRRIVNRWRAAKATFGWTNTGFSPSPAAIVVLTSGLMLGWPVRNLGVGNVLGGATVVWGPAEG